MKGKPVFSITLVFVFGLLSSARAIGDWWPVETIRDDFDNSERHVLPYENNQGQGMVLLCFEQGSSVRFFDYTAEDLGGLDDRYIVEEKFGNDSPDVSALSFTGYIDSAVNAFIADRSAFKRYADQVADSTRYAVRFYDRTGREYVIDIDTANMDRRLADLYERCGI